MRAMIGFWSTFLDPAANGSGNTWAYVVLVTVQGALLLASWRRKNYGFSLWWCAVAASNLTKLIAKATT